jgi:hypothetical protein
LFATFAAAVMVARAGPSSAAENGWKNTGVAGSGGTGGAPPRVAHPAVDNTIAKTINLFIPAPALLLGSASRHGL